MTSRPSFVAPARWAIQPPLTQHPELWRDAIAWPLFNGLSSVGLARNLPITNTVSSILSSRGHAVESTPSDAGIKYDATSINRTTSEITFVCWFYQTNPADTNPAFLFGNTTGNNSGIRVLAPSTQYTCRWRLPQAAGNLDVRLIQSGGQFVQLVGRLGAGLQSLDLYESGTQKTSSGSIATNASITLSDADYYLLTKSTGGNSFNGVVLYAYLEFRRWTDAQIEQNRRDPFSLFRPAPRVVVASGSTTLITLGAAMNSVSRLSGSINAQPGLSGIAASDAALSAAIDLQQGMIGSIDQASAFASSLDARPGLTGSIDSASDLSSNMAMQIGFASALASSAAFSGNLTLAAQALLSLSGTMASQSAFSNTLGLQLHLQGASDSASTMQSSLSMTQGMVAELAAESGLTGDLSALIGMAGNLDSAMTFDGAVGLLSELIGAMDSDSSWNGDLTLAAYVLGALIAHGINIRAALDAVFDLHPALNADITLQ